MVIYSQIGVHAFRASGRTSFAPNYPAVLLLTEPHSTYALEWLGNTVQKQYNGLHCSVIQQDTCPQNQALGALVSCAAAQIYRLRTIQLGLEDERCIRIILHVRVDQLTTLSSFNHIHPLAAWATLSVFALEIQLRRNMAQPHC